MSASADFRVFFSDGVKLVVSARTPDAARKAALGKHTGIVTKIKRVKEDA